MSTFAKIIEILNLLYLLVFIYFVLAGQMILSLLFTTLGLLIIVLPILIGMVQSIQYFIRSRTGKVAPTSTNNILALFVWINLLLIVATAIGLSTY
ncbi:MAG: hypothetical protein KDC44_23580 [Phaeodactylibacter sp.]|nr:hypothetical protein [Phaeodactylibacter sp.]